MSNKKVLLLDLDGICTDFVGGVCDLFDRDRQEIVDYFIENESTNLAKALGISTSAMWQVIDKKKGFWANLEPTKEYEAIRRWLDKYKEVEPVNWYYCTTPSLNPSSVSGKLHWIQKRHGRNFRQYVFTPHKHLLANHNTMLVDDRASNFTKFTNHNGYAILWPRPWNKFRDMDDVRPGVMVDMISDFCFNLNN